MQATAISSEEKRRALQELLQSATFRRAEQLRQFLEYIVEEEIAGRGAQISEWDIAVRALKRHEGYSPETDSTVRTRAHSIRQRLAEYYRIEAPQAEVQVELPKGGYTPRFFRVSEPEPEADVLPPEVILPPAPVAAVPNRRWLWACAGAGFALVCCGIVAAVLYSRGAIRLAPPPEPEIAEAWGPILAPSSAVRVILSSPYQLWVRDYGSDPPPVIDPVYTPVMPFDPYLFKSYAEHTPLHSSSKLYLHTNNAGALWGDAAGIQIATRFLAARGVKTELVPEKSIKSAYVLRNDSFVAFGRSEYSPLMTGKLPQNGFDVQYIASIRRHGIALRSNPDAGPKFLPDMGRPVTNYGLITVIRDTADDGHPCQAMFFSGVMSNGAQAAIEYMTTTRHLQELIAKLRSEGLRTWPKVLQIVVRSQTTEFYPVRTEYETHRVLQR